MHVDIPETKDEITLQLANGSIINQSITQIIDVKVLSTRCCDPHWISGKQMSEYERDHLIILIPRDHWKKR